MPIGSVVLPKRTQHPGWYALVAIVVACGGNHAIDRGGVDAGATLMDAGSFVDAGPSIDAGIDAGTPLDGGPADAGIASGSLTLSISANPNCVLTAIAEVSWTDPLTSVYISYSAATGDTGKTPSATLTAGPLKLPVLLLHPDTTYQFTAIAQDAAGNAVTSQPVTLTTGPMPASMPEFTVPSGSTAPPGYTMVRGTGTYVTVVDGAGNVVWYYDAAPNLGGGEFEQQTDGTLLVAVGRQGETIPGFDSPSAVHNQIDVLGNLIHAWLAVDAPLATPPITVVGTNGSDAQMLAGNVLLFGWAEQSVDLTASGGAASATEVGDVLESVTASGAVAFSWDSLDSLDPSEMDPACSLNTDTVFGLSDANGIAVAPDGNYVVSLRSLSQVIELNAEDGQILWRLGGAKSDFTFVGDPLNGFSCQQGLQVLPNGDVLLFDDGEGHATQASRVAEFSLDMSAMTATLVWSSTASPPLSSRGFVQRLQNGDTLVTYSSQIQELDPAGNLVWALEPTMPTYGLDRAVRVESLYPPSP